MLKMSRLFVKLRLDGLGRCSKNVWLSFLTIMVVVFANFNALIMPQSLFILLSATIVIYSSISFVGYFYWMVVLWSSFLEGEGVPRVLYLVVLGVINLANFYLLLKVVSPQRYGG